MKFIPTKVHGALDYIVGLFLILLPTIFDFNDGGAKVWVPVSLGIAAILYSLITNYEWGLLKCCLCGLIFSWICLMAFCWPFHRGFSIFLLRFICLILCLD